MNLDRRSAAHQRRRTHVAGTLYGKQDAPRIVGIDDHIVDLPPSSHMLVVRNDDTPGMIGTVGTILGDAGINIDDMDVGHEPERRGRADGARRPTRRCRAEVVEQLARQRRRRRRPRRSSSTESAQRFDGRRPSASAAVGVDVAAVGVGAVVVRAAGHVEDAARQLGLHRVRTPGTRRRRLDPGASAGAESVDGRVDVGAARGIGGNGNGCGSHVTARSSPARGARTRARPRRPTPARTPSPSSSLAPSCASRSILARRRRRCRIEWLTTRGVDLAD